MQHQIPEEDVVGPDTELACEEPAERLLAVADGPHRDEVLLRVQHQTLRVHVAVEMDRELRYPGDGTVDVDEFEPAAAQRDPACDSEITVEPRVEQRAAVHLDGEELHAGAHDIGMRFQP